MSDTIKKILTVTQLNEYIKILIENSPILSNVYIKGEISNFTNHYKTGHFYFTLKDDGSLIKAIMFQGLTTKLKFLPENGMKVILHGRISTFVRDGQYQIYTDDIEPDGIGSLYIAYEQLKNKLESEGLFREEIKSSLPKIPTRIGIVTSPTGAAIQDMINIIGRRFPYAKIILYPALVQGDDAAPQIIEGINYFNNKKCVDVVIVGRGGGSIEDLWAFNDEFLARTVRNSNIPIISAVGHETDFTICDFVADKRASTPSAAAEIAVPDTIELKGKISNIIGRMELLLSQNIKIKRQKLIQASTTRVLISPKNLVDDKRMLLLSLSQKLDGEIKLILSNKRNLLQNSAKLEALNPLSILSRGYSAVFKSNGEIIKSINQINIGEEFYFKTSDGNVTGIVTSKKENL